MIDHRDVGRIPLEKALAGADLGGDWEWIVVDDGSRDGTSEAVAVLAALGCAACAFRAMPVRTRRSSVDSSKAAARRC